MHSARLHFTAESAVKSVNRYWTRTLGVPFFVCYALTAVGAIVLILSGDRSWLAGALTAFTVLAAVFLGAIYRGHTKSAVQKYRDLVPNGVGFSFDDSGFVLETPSGKSETKWGTIHQVWTYPDAWLVFFAKAQYFTLPLSDLTQEQQGFIRTRLATAFVGTEPDVGEH